MSDEVSPERLAVLNGQVPGESDKIPQAPVEGVYTALSRFFARLASADGLQNSGERTTAQIEATTELLQSMQDSGASLVELGER